MNIDYALAGTRIFDGNRWYEDQAIRVQGKKIVDIVPRQKAVGDYPRYELEGGLLVPGFVDLQVNGGGGVQFNDAPDVESIRTICAAHAPFGTTAMLPTVITDRPEIVEAAIAAGHAATHADVPGFMGLHIEGPHISIERKGAHAEDLIRPMQDADLDQLVAARKELETLIVTLAPENVCARYVVALTEAGIMVSLGHTSTPYSVAVAAAKSGARMATHLFNAMSPLGHREPGMVGAALDEGTLFAGLIADGHHVDPAVMRIALRGKRGPGRIFLITDAMAPLGTDMTEFTLNGRTILRANGCLRLEDGTLAGADLSMIEAVRLIYRTVGVPLEEALRMASLYPAQAVKQAAHYGHLGAGTFANLVHLGDDLSMRGTWINGENVWTRPEPDSDIEPSPKDV